MTDRHAPALLRKRIRMRMRQHQQQRAACAQIWAHALNEITITIMPACA